MSDYHEPVLLSEVIDLLAPTPPGVIVDATFGGGGHARALAAAGDHRVVGIDRDPEARANAGDLEVLEGDFGDFDALLDDAGIGAISGALFDLGISSHQVDEAGRGFSYHSEGPLDMRMDTTQELSAAEVVNTYSEADLAWILRTYGEESQAKRIARAIVAARPIETTTELAQVVASAMPAALRRSGHPARKTFQAIRIEVNNELDSVRRGVEAALGRLDLGGRCAVISYHSLEDRIIKRRFVDGASGCDCPPELPVCACGRYPELRLVTRKPVMASDAEIAANPRARSARLRVAEKARAA
ncbi:MAG: 16S rRNA (cytosine(1402)-N(4))-methyltransferase RsmH [Acidimicrobiia bacterium]|nr:16S rRNA (cytosine(1402)-N(4))-methyltransferase RsmH [Acidimicrobiia bacterium]